MIKYLPIDPIDEGIIINEQALSISSKYSKHFTDLISLESFKKEI